MKDFSVSILVLSACLVPPAWAQQNAGTPRFGKHPLHRHRIVNGMPKAPGAAGKQDLAAPATAAAKLKTWDLGHYSGGTWADLGGINDFGVAVGMGDLPDGSSHTLAVPLFGPDALEIMSVNAPQRALFVACNNIAKTSRREGIPIVIG
jgi:hypothetical protein